MKPTTLPIFLLAAASIASAESFESVPGGPIQRIETSIGVWSAEAGHARIDPSRGRSGKQSLHLSGQGERAIVLQLSSPTEMGTVLAFYAERWTRNAPFLFRVDAKDDSAWREIRVADSEIKIGGFHSEVRQVLPEGTREVRFRVTAPEKAGILLDDVWIHRPGPARVTAVETVQPVVPAFIRKEFNPILGLRVMVEGAEGSVTMEAIELGFGGTTRMDDLASFKIFSGDQDPSAAPGKLVAESSTIGEKIPLFIQHKLAAGEHWFWVSPVLKETASIDGRVDASVFRVKVAGKDVNPRQPSPEGNQRIGYAVRLPGDDNSKAYRIPGLVRSMAGTLVAVYDIRYRHAGDLPADIDVGVSRSNDGGQSWEPMVVAMDMGNDPKRGYDGIGDPAILVDPKTGRLWIAALWSHGNRAWNGSGPGLQPEETGQLMLVHSDDDGKTWSKPVNITPQVKDPAWRLFFNGPGAGIALRDGTLVFPAQYRAANGVPWSTLIGSRDQGKTWQTGTGVKSDTTEAQVVQLADGSIMINCRDNRGGARTIAITKDLGKSWKPHPTDRETLREPVCMASLFLWSHPSRGDLLFFSNPDTTRGRHNMTIKLSRDQGMSWPVSANRLYDSRVCFGYSCLAPVGPDHVGVIYEGKGSMLYLRFPLNEWSE